MSNQLSALHIKASIIFCGARIYGAIESRIQSTLVLLNGNKTRFSQQWSQTTDIVDYFPSENSLLSGGHTHSCFLETLSPFARDVKILVQKLINSKFQLPSDVHVRSRASQTYHGNVIPGATLVKWQKWWLYPTC